MFIFVASHVKLHGTHTGRKDMKKVCSICPLFFNPMRYEYGRGDHYTQFFHVDDEICLQVLSDEGAPTGRVRAYGEPSGDALEWLSHAFGEAGDTLYYCTLPALSEGEYVVELDDVTVRDEVHLDMAVSEPFRVCRDVEGSVLIRVSDKDNNGICGNVWWTGDTQLFVSLRVEGGFKPEDNTYEVESESFRNQFQELRYLYCMPYTVYRLTVGREEGVPEYVAEWLNNAFSLSHVEVDGVLYRRSEDAVPERTAAGEETERYVVKMSLERAKNDIVGDGGADIDVTLVGRALEARGNAGAADEGVGRFELVLALAQREFVGIHVGVGGFHSRFDVEGLRHVETPAEFTREAHGKVVHLARHADVVKIRVDLGKAADHVHEHAVVKHLGAVDGQAVRVHVRFAAAEVRIAVRVAEGDAEAGCIGGEQGVVAHLNGVEVAVKAVIAGELTAVITGPNPVSALGGADIAETLADVVAQNARDRHGRHAHLVQHGVLNGVLAYSDRGFIDFAVLDFTRDSAHHKTFIELDRSVVVGGFTVGLNVEKLVDLAGSRVIGVTVSGKLDRGGITVREILDTNATLGTFRTEFNLALGNVYRFSRHVRHGK